jgi:uncharacterized membrane protein YsdA (DUF1294 family)/cold shock CspA family protein
MRFQGRITGWKDEQGYGFITPNLGGEKAFVHIKAFAHRQRRPAENDIVTYELSRDSRGRSQAGNVRFAGEKAKVRAVANSGPSRLPLFIAGAFFAVLGLVTLSGKLPMALLGLYLAASLLSFALYAHDKAAARNDRQRTAENTLHLLALIGGWPGALVAQNRLRHKSRKASFQLIFWTIVLLNCGFLGLLMTSAGGKALRAALGIY